MRFFVKDYKKKIGIQYPISQLEKEIKKMHEDIFLL